MTAQPRVSRSLGAPLPLRARAHAVKRRARNQGSYDRPPGDLLEQPQLNWIANFIWGIADDVLRDRYVRGKYRDVILPTR